MKLIIVRHGQTHENLAKILQGQTYGTLNQTGKEQAQKVAERLKNENIDVAYVSDLERTKETAKEILCFHPETPIIEEKALRERSWGVWEGKKSEEMKHFLEKHELTNNTFKPENGESFLEVQKRIVAFYHMILEKQKNKTILVVGHGGALASLYLFIFQKSIEEFKKYRPQNAAVSILEISDDKKHTVHVLNCVKHLE